MSNASLQSLPDIEEQQTVECVHYWIIDVPSGPVSGGKCRLCGESKDFRNSLESAPSWDDDRGASQASAAVRSSLSQIGGAGTNSDEEEN